MDLLDLPLASLEKNTDGEIARLNIQEVVGKCEEKKPAHLWTMLAGDFQEQRKYIPSSIGEYIVSQVLAATQSYNRIIWFG